MRVFTSSVIDKLTGMEVITSECSFNEACDFLSTKDLGNYLGLEPFGEVTKIKFDKRDFYYDENRKKLLAR